MSIEAILTSASERRKFLIISTSLIISLFLASIILNIYTDNVSFLSIFNAILASLLSSAAFAVVWSLYIWFFFVDRGSLDKGVRVIPGDIGEALKNVARNATNYKICVRTGRHFRAEILPILVENAVKLRRPITIEVILLDFRDESVCDKYAKFRKSSSFDKDKWNIDYVRIEVIATIIALLGSIFDHERFINVELYLSKRLSTFRIEGSSDEIIVTREDPKDEALRYVRENPNFSAYSSEFSWIKDESECVPLSRDGIVRRDLKSIFGDVLDISSLEGRAKEASTARSPYGR